MGQSAKCNIEVYFNTGEIPIQLSSATAVHQTLLQFYKESRNDSLATPDISVSEFESYDESIGLEFYSTRRQNLDFQVDLFREYLETYHDDIVEEMTEDTWVQA